MIFRKKMQKSHREAEEPNFCQTVTKDTMFFQTIYKTFLSIFLTSIQKMV